MAQTTRTLDWPTYPLQTPTGGGLAPTPNRSTTPAEGVLVAGEGLTNTLTSLVAREGLTKPLTNPGPLQKAGHLILTRPLKGCTALKSWAMKIAKRSGMKKAKVALARKLAVIMHRMLADGTSFRNAAAV